MTKNEALHEFRIANHDLVVGGDRVAKRLAWVTYTDQLHRSGVIDDYQVRSWVNPF